MTTVNLVWALREVLQAEQEENTAREIFISDGGCSWDYHGYRYAEASRKAGEALQKALNDAIDARIRAKAEGEMNDNTTTLEELEEQLKQAISTRDQAIADFRKAEIEWNDGDARIVHIQALIDQATKLP